MKLAHFPLYHPRNIDHLVRTMVARIDQVFVRNFRYISITVIARSHFNNTFNLVEKRMNVRHLPYTVALQV